MPKKIDVEKRLTEIAEATLRVAANSGSGAITIRSVSAEMGGSTAVVTNYVGTRADLLLNVILHVQKTWDRGMRKATDNCAGAELLRASILWSVTTDPQDPVMRSLWVDLLAESGPDSDAVKALVEITVRHRRLIRDSIEDITNPASSNRNDDADPEIKTDALYLMIRGFYFLSVEDPDAWTSDRITRALELTLSRFVK